MRQWPRTDFAVFVDLETTGNGAEDEIIEVGCSMVETERWSEVGSYSHLVIPSPMAWNRMMDLPVVRNMHTEGGLIAELSAVTTPEAFSVENIDRDVVRWLDTFLNGNTTHVPIGGSGLDHFDRKYLRRDMPLFTRRMSFWSYDAGVHRRTFRLAGRPWLVGNTTKPHRALADARLHAEEFRYALTAIRTGFDPEALKDFDLTMDY